MKKILLLLFLSAGLMAGAQFPNTVTSGNTSTLYKSNGAFGGNLGYVFTGSYGDTTAANLSFIKNVAGQVIRVGDTLWMRNQALTKWIKIGGGAFDLSNYVLRTELADTATAIRADFPTGGGIDSAAVRDIIRTDTVYSPVFYTYRVGDDGAPAEVDSVVANSLFAHKFIKVYRNGFLQYWDSYSGVTYDSATGAITFHGPFTNGEYILIEGRYTANDSAVGVNGVMGYGTGGGTSYDSDAQAYFDAQATAGNTMSTADKNAWNTFITGLKSDGTWSKFTQMNFLAFGNFTKNKINVKSPGTLDLASSNGTITYSSGGATGDGSTGYINSGVNPSTTLSVNDLHISVYLRTNNLTNGFDAGSSDFGLTSQVLISAYNGTGEVIRIGDWNYQAINSSPTNTLGLFVGTRTSSSSLKITHNASVTGSDANTNSIAAPNKNIFLLAANADGTAGAFSDRQMCFYTCGLGLTTTEITNFNTRLETLLDYYGIGVQ